MIVWYVTCRECTMSHYTPATGAKLVMAFRDQDEQKRWSTQHRKEYGHRTQDYFRRLPDREEP